MPQLSPILYEARGLYFYKCPGCDRVHGIPAKVGGKEAEHWEFNGDVNKPTFKPSVRHFWPVYKDGKPTGAERTLCHYHVIDGQIAYCNDSPHALSGKTVPLPPLPENYGWPDTPR